MRAFLCSAVALSLASSAACARVQQDEKMVVPLKHISADQAVTAISKLPGKMTVRILAADPTTNSLIVAGAKPTLNALKLQIAKLDTPIPAPRPAKPAGAADVRIFRLKNSLSTDVASLLAKLGLPTGVQKVVPDPRTNTLIVRANDAGLTELTGLIQQLDEPSAFQSTGDDNTLVVPLRFALSSDTLKVLRSTVLSTNNARVASDDRTNSLVIVGSKDDVNRLRELIEALDRPAPNKP